MNFWLFLGYSNLAYSVHTCRCFPQILHLLSKFLAYSLQLKLGLFCAYLSVFSSNISSSQLIFLRIHCRHVCILCGEDEEARLQLREGISTLLLENLNLNVQMYKLKAHCQEAAAGRNINCFA